MYELFPRPQTNEVNEPETQFQESLKRLSMSFLLIADLQFVRVRVSCKGRIYMYNISTEEGRRGLRVINASRGGVEGYVNVRHMFLGNGHKKSTSQKKFLVDWCWILISKGTIILQSIMSAKTYPENNEIGIHHRFVERCNYFRCNDKVLFTNNKNLVNWKVHCNQ